MLAPQARRASAADGLSSSASSRCSTVMNSCRFCLASTKAMCKLTSSSCAIIQFSSMTQASGCWMLAGESRDLFNFRCCDVPDRHRTDHVPRCVL